MTCSIDGCGRPLKCLGLCSTHYQRTRRGKPLDSPVLSEPRPAEDRFWEKVNKTDDCWLWTGSTDRDGYGYFNLGGIRKATTKTVKSHRVSYAFIVGPIPEGRELDHLCRVRNCVNPEHLEAVTHAENSRRRDRKESA